MMRMLAQLQIHRVYYEFVDNRPTAIYSIISVKINFMLLNNASLLYFVS